MVVVVDLVDDINQGPKEEEEEEVVLEVEAAEEDEVKSLLTAFLLREKGANIRIPNHLTPPFHIFGSLSLSLSRCFSLFEFPRLYWLLTHWFLCFFPSDYLLLLAVVVMNVFCLFVLSLLLLAVCGWLVLLQCE